MKRIAAVLAVGVLAAGCGPKPGFSVRQERVEIDRTFNENGTIKSEKVVGQNVIEGKFQWPTNGNLALSREETFQPDNKGREVLTAASWAVTASSDSTEAMVFGVNQTDQVADTVKVGLKTAGAVGTAGLSGAPDIAAQVAEAIVGQEDGTDTATTLDSAGGILNANPATTEGAATTPAPAVSADDADTTDTASGTVVPEQPDAADAPLGADATPETSY